MGRLLKGIPAGASIGADDISRWLSPDQRATMIARLSGDVEARGMALISESRATAAAILAEAEASAGSVQGQAHATGYQAGYEAGMAQAQAEMDHILAMLRRAAEGAEAVRTAMLAGVEEQAVDLALVAARRIVGAAADTHTQLAADIVRLGLRNAGSKVVRVRVHPDDAESVTAALLSIGSEVALHTDSAIEAGGCLIDVEGGTIDLRLGVQLDSIERVLRAA
jgi:flagellar assembly protein FliH